MTKVKPYINDEVENRIFTIQGIQVMIDRDLAELYQVDTKVLNQAVKRNIERFPDKFRFQLTETENMELVTNCDRFKNLRSQIVTSSGKHGGSRYLPYAFTEQGIAMLSAVLRSETAIKISILIMDAFVEMRKVLSQNAGLIQRLDKFESRLIENDDKFDKVFKALESKSTIAEKGLFFDGQVFDAWTFVSDLVRSAKTSIQLIDNYVDDTVLKLLAKREPGTTATIYTKTIGKQLATDLLKHNTQYPDIKIHELAVAHDRFIIIDQTELYHIGASLKDLGKKCFAFSKMNEEVVRILNLLKQ
ncbi:ORF6N domain-containing protein [Flavobacterium ranwuense]|uniref:ORF6N domain-containing protein n=1 Tax=Flavobacterium ranwuense TaxID=2541725 RepID=A0ABY2DVW6_9FLAO|nr:ORF6N domain-containing protein [Flavobacterium ranwuense]TDE31573.1 ORF6N domain-containing protein [Flavobacterium ranwuense]